MGYQLSPGVLTREFDLTTVVPGVSTTEAAFVGQFRWGPIMERTLIESENELVSTFWKPDSNTYEDFFTAANFLAYGNQLWTVRVVDETNVNTALQAKNATVSNADGFLVKNEDHYINNYDDGSLDSTHGCGEWVAKYAGVLGNSLKISVCPSANAYQSLVAATGTLTFTTDNTVATAITVNPATTIQAGDFLVVNNTTVQVSSVNSTAVVLTSDWTEANSTVDANTVYRRWEYYNEVDVAPGTTDYVSNRAGSADEVHIVIADANGAWTGTRGTILEVFQKMSLASDAKLDDGTTNYYKEVINQRSKYIWWASHDTVNLNTNAGDAAAGTTFAGNVLPLTYTLQGGKDGAVVGNQPKILGYDLFRNAEDVDISLIIGGNAQQAVAVHIINNIAEFREDCIAILSPPKSTVINNVGDEAVDVVAFRNLLPSTSWAVLDCNWKYQYDKYNDVYRWVPLSGDIAGLMVFTDVQRDPWWSPAGFNRGKIKNVIKLAWNPSKTDRDHLYKNGVNPVFSSPNEGTVLYGDKTLLAKPSAFDRINVRRLFIVLRKAIARAAKYTLFELNDAYTRQGFKSMVDPYLRDVQGRRGIYDFRVVCDESNNTGEVIDRNEFVADIYIKPARSINYITLNFIAVRTSVEFSEIVGKY